MWRVKDGGWEDVLFHEGSKGVTVNEGETSQSVEQFTSMMKTLKDAILLF